VVSILAAFHRLGGAVAYCRHDPGMSGPSPFPQHPQKLA
jgi:hypothetical protein